MLFVESLPERNLRQEGRLAKVPADREYTDPFHSSSAFPHPLRAARRPAHSDRQRSRRTRRLHLVELGRPAVHLRPTDHLHSTRPGRRSGARLQEEVRLSKVHRRARSDQRADLSVRFEVLPANVHRPEELRPEAGPDDQVAAVPGQRLLATVDRSILRLAQVPAVRKRRVL